MMKQNDKSSLIGLILMAAILIIFNAFVFDNVSEQELKESHEKLIKDRLVGEDSKFPEMIKESEEKNNITKISEIDSTDIRKEEFYTLENENIKLDFTNKGGEISSAVIKGYYSYQEYKKNIDDDTYQSKDIEIFNNKDSKFEITGDRNIITNELFFVEESNNSISFRKNYEKDSYIKYTYSLDDNEPYFVDFSIESEGISNPELIWTIAAPETEKSKTNQEQYTGFYYQEDYSKDVDYTWDNDKFEINESPMNSI